MTAGNSKKGCRLAREVMVGAAATVLVALGASAGPVPATADSASAAAPRLTRVGVHGAPSSQYGSQTFKYAAVRCPVGQRVIGGGARLVNLSTTPFYGRVVLTSLVPASYRTPTGQYEDSYYADARELSGGFDGDWTIHVSAVCADHNSDNWLSIVRQDVSEIVRDGSRPRIRATHASCPSGTEVLGTGAILVAHVLRSQEVTASFQQVRPNQQGRYVYVEGISGAPVWNGLFSRLSAFAVCGDADLGQHVHIDGTDPSTKRVQFATGPCGPGEEVTGAGMTKGDDTGQAHVESINPVPSSPDKVKVEASAVPLRPSPWNLAAWAVCVP
jgi:hypothetical protein